jgi:ABC-type multidrug transport system fused ATPase/permease subunit
MQTYTPPRDYVPSPISSKDKEYVDKFSASMIKSVLSFALITMLFGVICSCITINRGHIYGSNLDIGLGSISLVFLFIFLVLFFVLVSKFGSFQKMFQPWIDSLSKRILELMGMKREISKPNKQEIELTTLPTAYPSSVYTPPLSSSSTSAYSDHFSDYSNSPYK